MPNRITDNEEFRDFVQELDPRYSSMPRRGALNKEIEVIMVEMKQKIKALLQTARKINLTADIWSKKGMSSSFLGVTAHFFNRKDHKRYTLTLSVRLFETPHTGYRILRLLKTILSEYDIGIKSIGIILTDNGSNMIKAFNADLLHNLEEEDEGLEQDVEIIDEASGSGENFESTENSAREDIQDNAEIHEYENNEEEHDLAFNGFCQRLGCFSHTLQLVMSEFDSIRSLKKVIKKAQELVSKCNKSVKVTEKLIQLSGKKLVSNCPTRWSSSYLLIERLIQLKPHLTDILAELEWDNLQNSEYKALENIRDLLEPFARYTQLASAEDVSTISMVIPIIMELRLHLDEMKAKPGLSSCTKVLQDALDRRFKDIIKPGGKNSQTRLENVYVAATFLDLRTEIYLTTNKLKLQVLTCLHLLDYYQMRMKKATK